MSRPRTPLLPEHTGMPATKGAPDISGQATGAVAQQTPRAGLWPVVAALAMLIPLAVALTLAPPAAAQEDGDEQVPAGEVTGLQIQPEELTVEVDERQPLEAIATLADGSEQDVSDAVTWSSDNSNVAPISPGGTVSGEFGGTAEITAELDGVSATATINVDQPFFEWLDQSINTVSIPFDWLRTTIDWLNREADWVFDAIAWPIGRLLDGLVTVLQWLPWYVTALGIGAIGWWRLGSLKAGIAFTLSMVLLGFLAEDIWGFAMTTLAMILTAVVACAIIGIPVGIWASSSDAVYRVVRPVLDAMQTIHPFIYLIPIIFFFGVGTVPGTIATFIFAIPPVVRLTNLGIRQVPGETVEAAQAFGSTDRQTLWEVQLPLARPAIMQGLNQSLMLAYSMVVIAAIVAAGGLGQLILRSTQRLDVPGAASSGIAVLILAIILDRLSQSQRSATAEE